MPTIGRGNNIARHHLRDGDMKYPMVRGALRIGIKKKSLMLFHNAVLSGGGEP
jgi:hypothetical protein